MSPPESYSFTRYLKSKKSVEDRALNRHVWANLARELAGISIEPPLRVLELGAGVGTMIERSIGWGLLTQATYVGLDSNQEVIQEAGQRLPRWASQIGFSVEQSNGSDFKFSRGTARIDVALDTADMFEFLAQEANQSAFDLVIGSALLDLLDLPDALPPLLSSLRPGGLIYFTINFDGLTILEPEIDSAFDAKVAELYHQSMDGRLPEGMRGGDSRTGRHLFGHLRNAGVDIIDSGASDWVVFPVISNYPSDEAYFLHYIVHTIHQALEGHAELDAKMFEEWLAQRKRQIDDAQLVYIAHQLDFLGRMPV